MFFLSHSTYHGYLHLHIKTPCVFTIPSCVCPRSSASHREFLCACHHKERSEGAISRRKDSWWCPRRRRRSWWNPKQRPLDLQRACYLHWAQAQKLNSVCASGWVSTWPLQFSPLTGWTPSSLMDREKFSSIIADHLPRHLQGLVH